MEPSVVRDTIKQSITRITGIPPQHIADTASYRHDLDLDSLSILEIAVDAEMCFGIKIPDALLPEIQTVQDAVRVICEQLPASAV
jgi:acyl carrier protein